jgi:tetratricopeptide (TPR) repeat protein
MSRRFRLALLICVALCASGVTVLRAQSMGRLSLLLLDADGEPLPGAEVLVTCPELPHFRDESTTNKKGKVLLAFPDSTRSYRLQIEKEGYQPVDMEYQPKAGQVARRQIQLQPVRGPSIGLRETGPGSASAASQAVAVGLESLAAGDLAAAEAHFHRALEEDNSLAPAHSALAGLYLQKGEYESAVAAAQSLLELEPDNPRGFRALYEAHKALGQAREAEAALAKLSQLDRGADTAALLFNEGVEDMRAGDLGAAKARFEEVLGLEPEFLQAHLGLALCHLREGSFEAAAAAAERALELDPGNLRALEIGVDAYRALGNKQMEEAALEALGSADPRTASGQLFERGVELFAAGDTAGAIGLFQRAVELDPENPRAHYKLGLCYISSGETAEAREHLQRFLELAPDDPEAPSAREMLGYLD